MGLCCLTSADRRVLLNPFDLLLCFIVPEVRDLYGKLKLFNMPVYVTDYCTNFLIKGILLESKKRD